MTVAGVILAAGTSSRLGRPKQLVTLDGEAITRIVTRQALASSLDDVVLVLGSAVDAVAAAVGELGQRNVFNPDFAEGQSTSMRAGLVALPPATEAVIFLLGDQPEVSTETIDAVVTAFRDGATIAQATYGGKPSHPVLFARSLFDELSEVEGDEGARSVMMTHAAVVTRVAVSDGPPPGDVDTEADYEALKVRWAARA